MIVVRTGVNHHGMPIHGMGPVHDVDVGEEPVFTDAAIRLHVEVRQVALVTANTVLVGVRVPVSAGGLKGGRLAGASVMDVEAVLARGEAAGADVHQDAVGGLRECDFADVHAVGIPEDGARH